MTEYNGWASLADPAANALFAAAGFDSVTLDAQHGFFDEGALLRSLLALSAPHLRRYVRLAAPDPVLVGRALDAGADGVIAPMVDGAEDARRLARAAHYPPRGRRSWGPFLAAARAGSRPYLEAAAEVDVFVMIETRDALEAVQEIAAVDGVTGLYVGPNDLALSLGLGPGSDREEDALHGAFHRVIEAARRHGRRAGIYCAGAAYARRMAEAGFDLVTVVSDAAVLSAGARAAAEAARG